MSIATIFTQLQASSLARTIGGSTTLTGFLSGVHLVGMTLIGGGALVFTTRAFRLAGDPNPQVRIRTAEVRVITGGLIISILTGLLLLLPRLSASIGNPIFVTKMLLVLAAAAWHLTLGRRAARAASPTAAGRAAVTIELVLWYAVVFAGCAFILYEE
jgi:hypothetical protein